MIKRANERYNEAVAHRLSNRLDDCGEVIEKLWHSGYQNPWAAMLRGNLALDRGEYENAHNWHSLAWSMIAPGGEVKAEHTNIFQDAALAYAYSRMRLGWWDAITWTMWETGRMGRSWNPAPHTRPWTGSKDKMIVLSEGGYGDAFLFTRFFQRLDPLQRAASRFVMGPKFAGLKGLLDEWDGMKCVHSDEPFSWKPFSYSTSLMSLMSVMGIRSPEDIPAAQSGIGERPYEFRGSPSAGRTPRFGLCWKAEENGVQKRIRSIDKWGDLEPISQWEFINLCPGLDFSDDTGWERPVPILKHYDLKTWRDTARLLLTLDCVVSVDTAVAHLAGLLNVPCLLILPLAVDWKFGVAGESTFWWPSVRLIRNTSPYSFQPAIEKVAEILEKW